MKAMRKADSVRKHDEDFPPDPLGFTAWEARV